MFAIKKDYEILENRQETDKLSKRFQKAVNMIIRKNEDNYYQADLRFVFT